MLQTNHTIINGDCRYMKEVADKSVHLIITSPPYWQLKDYGTANQIGFNDSYEQYINHLNLVWKECYRVLHDGCRLCINIGDQFARSVYYGRYKVIPIHSEIIRFCEAVGFDFMGQIIWQKSTTMNTTGGGAVMGSFPYPRNGIAKLDYEYILLFKKQGKAPVPSVEQKDNSKMTNEEWNTYFNGHWYFNGARQDKHLAMFPDELPKRLIKMFSFYGETVMDPFLGSGTTSAVARMLGRNSIGYEINPDYIPLIKQRIGGDSLYDSTICNVIPQEPIHFSFDEKIRDLPYRFVDVHKINNRTDLKKLQFGSKIDRDSSTKRENLFSVRTIVSPEQIVLNNGLVIRLIGIKTDPSVGDKAIDYLTSKLKGNKVFLRFDSEKYDRENHLLSYLYLENKTFINAHLLKQRLALVDDSIEFKYKSKFINLYYGKGMDIE